MSGHACSVSPLMLDHRRQIIQHGIRHVLGACGALRSGDRHAHVAAIRREANFGVATKNLALDLVPVRDGGAVHGANSVTGMQLRERRCRRRRPHSANDRCGHDVLSLTQHDHCGDDQREQRVHRHAGKHDDNALPQGLALEPAVLRHGLGPERDHRFRVVLGIVSGARVLLFVPALDE
jgi:hypothetical protein